MARRALRVAPDPERERRSGARRRRACAPASGSATSSAAAGGEAELVDRRDPRRSRSARSRASSGAATRRRCSSTATSTSSRRTPLEQWDSPPFEPTIRDDWLYARGVADDKGNLYLLLKAAALLARRGRAAGERAGRLRRRGGDRRPLDRRLPRADERGADACIIFDGGMPAPRRARRSTSATRGLVYFHVTVRTGERDLHSGVFGGAALNAMHALMQTLARRSSRDARTELRARRSSPPTDEERASWARARPGRRACSPSRARGRATERAAEEFYDRTFAEPAVDVNGIQGGSPHAAEDGAPGRGRGERLDPPRARAGCGGDRARVRAAAARGRARGRRAGGRALVVGAGRARAARLAGGAARLRTRSSACSACGRCCSARAGRCRSCRRSSTSGIPTILTRLRAARARTSTRRTSGCSSATSRSASQTARETAPSRFGGAR